MTRYRQWRLLAAGGVLAAAALGGCGSPEPAAPPATLPYADEYPAIGYAANEPEGPLGQLARRLGGGAAGLSFRPGRGYLDAVLEELAIDPSSQVLVFSRTSLQTRHIGPATPRAIYFNDESYVAFVPGAPSLELAGFDPGLGPVFYNLAQDGSAGSGVERRQGACLRCHDTYGLSGGGVPRFLLGSGYTGTDGELVSHEAWILTDQATPLRSRWGGWYVTGRHGAEVHLGNIVVEKAEDLGDLEALRVGNVDELGALLDTSQYPTPYSDIVALMVLEHQVEVQNLISRLRFETVGRSDADSEPPAEHVDALVAAMLMAGEARFVDPISGGSGFSEHFESLGPFDSEGRTLRELDLETRLFRYPLSYLIYSDAFQALPRAARDAVYARLRPALEGAPGQADAPAAALAEGDRAAIRGILRETLPEVLSPQADSG